jgi:hypothetical protein
LKLDQQGRVLHTENAISFLCSGGMEKDIFIASGTMATFEYFKVYLFTRQYA